MGLKRSYLIVGAALIAVCLIGTIILYFYQSSSKSSSEPVKDLSLLPARIDGKCGYINQDGKVVIPPSFDLAGNFIKGRPLTWVHFGNKMGLIDRSGRIVLSPQYDLWLQPETGEYYEIVQAGKHGLADANGTVTATPQFDFIRGMDREGLLAAELGTKWGLIDIHGRWVVQPVFDELGRWPNMGPSGAWLPFDRFLGNIGTKLGYVTRGGQFAIPPTFDDANPFDDVPVTGAAVRASANESASLKWGLIDTSGKWVVAPRFDDLGRFGDNGLAPARLGEKVGFIDAKGDWLIHPQFLQADRFSKKSGRWLTSAVLSISPDRKSAQWAIIDDAGKIVYGPTSGDLHHGVDENGLVRESVRSGSAEFMQLTDLNDRSKAPITYKFIFQPVGTLYPAESERGWGVIDTAGNVVITFMYEWVTVLSDSLFKVKLGNVWGLVDRSNKFVVQPRFGTCWAGAD